MSLSKLLPTLDNAGKRLILSEVLGEPISLRLARQRKARYAKANMPSSEEGSAPSKKSSLDKSSSATQSTRSPLSGRPTLKKSDPKTTNLDGIDLPSLNAETTQNTDSSTPSRPESLRVKTTQPMSPLNNTPDPNNALSEDTKPIPKPVIKETVGLTSKIFEETMSDTSAAEEENREVTSSTKADQGSSSLQTTKDIETLSSHSEPIDSGDE